LYLNEFRKNKLGWNFVYLAEISERHFSLDQMSSHLCVYAVNYKNWFRSIKNLLVIFVGEFPGFH